MRYRILLFAIVTLATSTGNSLFAQQPSRPDVSIQQLRNAAAADVVKALKALADQKSLALTFVAEPASNKVIVAGDPAQMKEVLEIITRIDTLPPMIHAQMVIMDVPAGFAKEIGLSDGAEESWSLTDRELQMMNVAIRHNKQVNILSRQQSSMAENQSSLFEVGAQTDGYSIRLTPRVIPHDGLIARLDNRSKKSSEPTLTNTITAKVRDGGTIVVRLGSSVVRDNETHDRLLIMTLQQLKN